MKNKWILVVALMAFIATVEAASLTGRVVGVTDGDSITQTHAIAYLKPSATGNESHGKTGSEHKHTPEHAFVGIDLVMAIDRIRSCWRCCTSLE